MSLNLDARTIDGVLQGNIKHEVNREADTNAIFEKCFGKEFADLFISQEFTELMINGCESVFFEKEGRILETDIRFSDVAISMFVEEVSHLNSRNIDFSHPVFDGKLPGSYRCNIVVPPVSLNGTLVTLRKHIQRMNNFDALVSSGMLTKEVSEILIRALLEKQNIIIAGGTGTGKTTLVNVLFNSLGENSKNERIITIEDTAELNIMLPHVLKLESRFKTPDCPFEVTIRDLVKTALRMRPDRVVVGEVRGEEAYDLLHAVNTGHKGTVCTIHANSCRDALRRLETLAILGHSNLDVSIPRSWIASNINMVVYIERCSGLRKVSQVQSIIGAEAGNYVLEDLL